MNFCTYTHKFNKIFHANTSSLHMTYYVAQQYSPTTTNSNITVESFCSRIFNFFLRYVLCFETLANLIYPSLSYYNLRRRSTKYSSMILFAINTIPPDQHPPPSTDPVTTLILSITLPDCLL